MAEKNYKAMIEAVLFTMGQAVPLNDIADAIELSAAKTRNLILEMKAEYDTDAHGITIIELDGSFQMCTKTAMYEPLIKIASTPKKHHLTDVLLETLAIIAYKQPVTKAEIEKIRGVSSDHAVNRLVEYGLVMELGRLDVPGRPILFGTTEEFLRCFDVSSTEQLPVMDPVQMEEFKQEVESEMNVNVTV